MKIKFLKFLLFILFVTSHMMGCSIFQLTNDKSRDSAFFSTATSIENPDVVPAEVALDIKEVLRGGKPSFSSVDSAAVAQAKEISKEETAGRVSNVVSIASKTEPEFSAESSPDNSPRTPSSNEQYKVKKGDTLMKISFEKFGSLYRWREIYNANKDVIADFNRPAPGTVLTIQGIDYVVIQKNGKAYLIRKNDTLVRISNTLYGTPAGWKGLWANNLQLIKDPNKIYAGFNLYYLPLNDLPKQVPKLAYSNQKQKKKLKYIESLRKPAKTK